MLHSMFYFDDGDCKYKIDLSRDFVHNLLWISMSRFSPSRNESEGWTGLYQECPYLSEEAKLFCERMLKLKAFW